MRGILNARSILTEDGAVSMPGKRSGAKHIAKGFRSGLASDALLGNTDPVNTIIRGTKAFVDVAGGRHYAPVFAHQGVIVEPKPRRKSEKDVMTEPETGRMVYKKASRVANAIRAIKPHPKPDMESWKKFQGREREFVARKAWGEYEKHLQSKGDYEGRYKGAIKALLGKTASKKKQQRQVTPHMAMLELFRRKGMMTSGMTMRGAKFAGQLLEASVGKIQDSAVQAMMQGNDVGPHLGASGRMKYMQMQRLLKPYDEDRLMMIVREDPQLGRVAMRIMKRGK
jgi:hypothetical protein